MYFFFFQAEDGIRDYKVTGVQTCALPIYDAQPFVADQAFGAREPQPYIPPNTQPFVPRDNQPYQPREQRDAQPPEMRHQPQIGRASCRERGEMWEGGVARERVAEQRSDLK